MSDSLRPETLSIDELVEKSKQLWLELEAKIEIKDTIPKSKDRDLKSAFDSFFDILEGREYEN